MVHIMHNFCGQVNKIFARAWALVRYEAQEGKKRYCSATGRNRSQYLWGDGKFCCCCSVVQSDLTLFNPMDCSMPGLPVHHHLLELTQTHVRRVDDASQPSPPLSSPSPPAISLSQPQGLFQSVGFSHQEAKVLELQLQHQSFQ